MQGRGAPLCPPTPLHPPPRGSRGGDTSNEQGGGHHHYSCNWEENAEGHGTCAQQDGADKDAHLGPMATPPQAVEAALSKHPRVVARADGEQAGLDGGKHLLGGEALDPLEEQHLPSLQAGQQGAAGPALQGDGLTQASNGLHAGGDTEGQVREDQPLGEGVPWGMLLLLLPKELRQLLMQGHGD